MKIPKNVSSGGGGGMRTPISPWPTTTTTTIFKSLFNYSLFSRDHSSGGQILRWSVKAELLGPFCCSLACLCQLKAFGKRNQDRNVQKMMISLPQGNTILAAQFLQFSHHTIRNVWRAWTMQIVDKKSITTWGEGRCYISTRTYTRHGPIAKTEGGQPCIANI